MIYKLLAKIQQELRAPKDMKNNFGNYNYRSAEQILEKVKPIIREAGAALVLNDEVQNIGGMNYIKATATLYLDGASVSSSAYAREAISLKGMVEPQLTGSCSSYARKYALGGLFAICDSKDDPDSDNFHKKTKKAEELPAQGDAKRLEQLRRDIIILSRGDNDKLVKWIAAFCEKNGITHQWDELTEAELVKMKVALARAVQNETKGQ